MPADSDYGRARRLQELNRRAPESTVSREANDSWQCLPGVGVHKHEP